MAASSTEMARGAAAKQDKQATFTLLSFRFRGGPLGLQSRYALPMRIIALRWTCVAFRATHRRALN